MDEHEKIFREMIRALEDSGKCFARYHALGAFLFPEMAHDLAKDLLEMYEHSLIERREISRSK